MSYCKLEIQKNLLSLKGYYLREKVRATTVVDGICLLCTVLTTSRGKGATPCPVFST